MVRDGCVFVAGIHPSRTRMPGSFESVRWNACVHRLGLHSHPKEFWGNGVRAHVNSKEKKSPLPQKKKKKKNPQRRTEPTTLHEAGQRRELSPTHTLKWPGTSMYTSRATHRLLITYNMSCATWYEGTAQLLSLTELKWHLL